MKPVDVYGIIQMVIGVATAGSVLFAAIQIRISQEHETTRFEDAMAREYRDITQRIPTRAMLGEPLSDAEFQEAFDEFYRYFSLSNEQVYYWKSGRVRRGTWRRWRVGILANLARPAFRRAWEEVRTKLPESELGGLRWLETHED